MSPVTSPASARLRRQIRHIWNLRRNARGRPHSGHRLYLRTANFGLRFAWAIFESLAIRLSSLYWRKGRPKCRSRASPRSSFPAVVTKLMFSPFTFSIWS